MISIQDNHASWYCTYCIKTIIPFNNIEDDIYFLEEIEQSSFSEKALMYLSDRLPIPFELHDEIDSSMLSESGTDLHYYNSFNLATVNCNCFCRVN